KHTAPGGGLVTLGSQNRLQGRLKHNGGEYAANHPGNDLLSGHGAELVVPLGQLLNQAGVAAEITDVGEDKPPQQHIGGNADHTAHNGGTFHSGESGIDHSDGHADEHTQLGVEIRKHNLQDRGHG